MMEIAPCTEMWPSICESNESEWNFVSGSPFSESSVISRERSGSFATRSLSVPNLQQYDMCEAMSESSEDSGAVKVEDEMSAMSSAVDVAETIKDDISELSLPTDRPGPSAVRAPSFRDAVLANARETAGGKTMAERARKKKNRLVSPRRTGWAPVLKVEAPSLRNSVSSIDLRALDRPGEDGEFFGDQYDAGGFYARKTHGSTQHTNSGRLRPDEAKRKAFIICKKGMQRQSAMK